MILAKQNEDGFIQRTLINARFNLNCSRLTLWEYMLLLEHINKDKNA